METKLEFIFGNVNGWLKYVETKNVALLTLSTAIIVCLLQLIKSIEYDSSTKYYISILYFLFVFSVSATRALWSFVAKLDKLIIKPRNSCYISSNLIFYGEIHKFDAEHYLILLYQKYGDKKIPQPLPAYELDLANQIIVNSNLTIRKGTLFNNTIYGIIFSVVLFFVVVILLNIFNKGSV